MRPVAIALLTVLSFADAGCVGRRRGGGGGGDDDDSVADGDADADSDADSDADADADGDADGDADPCANPDRDGDLHPALVCGGDDCNDLDATVHPGAPDGGSWSSDTVWGTSVYYPVVAVDTGKTLGDIRHEDLTVS